MMGKEEASGTDNSGQIKSPAGGRQEFTPWSSVPGPSKIGSELSQRQTNPLNTTDESSLPGNRDETSCPLKVFTDTAEETTSCSDSKSDKPVSNLKDSLERIESAISQGSHFEIPPDLENPNSSPIHPPLIRTASGSSPSSSPFFSRDIDLSSIVQVEARDDLLTVPSNSDVNKIFNIVNSSLVKDFDKALKDQVPNTCDSDSLHTSDEDSLLNTSIEEVVEKDVSVASDLDSLETTQESFSKVKAVPSSSKHNHEKDNTPTEVDMNGSTSLPMIAEQDSKKCISEEDVQNPSKTDPDTSEEPPEKADDSLSTSKKDENIQQVAKKSKSPFFNFDSLIPSESTISLSTPTINDFATSSDLPGFSNVISTASILSFTEFTDDSSSMIDIRDCAPPVSSTDLKAVSVPTVGIDKALINNTQCPVDGSGSKGPIGLSTNIKLKVERTDNAQATCSKASVSNNICDDAPREAIKEEKIPRSQDPPRSGEVLSENADANDDKIDLLCTLNIGSRFYQREASNDKTPDTKSDDSDDVIIIGVKEAPKSQGTVVIISDDSSSPGVVEISTVRANVLSPVVISDDGMDDDEVITTFPDSSSRKLGEGNPSKDVDFRPFDLAQQGTSSGNNANSADCQEQDIISSPDEVSTSDNQEQENVSNFEQENVSDEGNSCGGLEQGMPLNSGEDGPGDEQGENVAEGGDFQEEDIVSNPEEVNVPDNEQEENDYSLTNGHVQDGEDNNSDDDNSCEYQPDDAVLNFQPFNDPNHVEQGNGYGLANGRVSEEENELEEDNSSDMHDLLDIGPPSAPNNVEQENVPESVNDPGNEEPGNGPEEGNASEEVIVHDIGEEEDVLQEGSSSNVQVQDVAVNLEALNTPSNAEQGNLNNGSHDQDIDSNSENIEVPNIEGVENESEEATPSNSLGSEIISNSEEVPMEGDCVQQDNKSNSSGIQDAEIMTNSEGNVEQGIVSNSGEVSTGVDRMEQDNMSNSSDSQEDIIVSSSEGIVAPDCKEQGIVSNSGEANASNCGEEEGIVSEETNSSDSQEHRVVSNSEGVNASDHEEQGNGTNSEETTSSDSQENRIVSNSEGVNTFDQPEGSGIDDQEQEIVSTSGEFHIPDPEGELNETNSEETNSSDDQELEYVSNAGEVNTPDNEKRDDDTNGNRGAHNSEDDNIFDGEQYKSNNDNDTQSQKQGGLTKAEGDNNSYHNQEANGTNSDEPSSSVGNNQENVSSSEETNTLVVQEQGVDNNSDNQPQGNVSNQEDDENALNSEEKLPGSILEEEDARCFGEVIVLKLDLKELNKAEIIEESRDGGISLDGESTNENSAPEVDLSAISDERPSMQHHTTGDFNQNEDSTLSDQIGKGSDKLPCQDKCKNNVEDKPSEIDIHFEDSSSNSRSNIGLSVAQSSSKDSYPLIVKVKDGDEEKCLEGQLSVDQNSEESLNLYLDEDGQSTKSVDKDFKTSDAKDGFYSSPIPLDVIIDEGETVMSPFASVSESSSTLTEFNTEEGACSKYRTFSAATTDNSDGDDSLVVSKVNIKIEEDVDIGSSILTIKVEDMDLDVISSSKDVSNKYGSVSVDIGDSNVPLSSLLKNKINLSQVDKKPLRSKMTNIEQIADKLVAGGRFRPLAPKPHRDDVLDGESYDQSGALLAAALGCGNIPKITSAVEILRVDSPKAIRKKPDLTPSVSLIPADVAYTTPKSFSSNTSSSVSSISSLISSTSKDKGIPSQILQLSNFNVELRNVQSKSPKSPYIQPTGGAPPITSGSLARLSSVQPQPSKGRSSLNIPSCYPPPPTIPQVIPRPRGRVPIDRLPSQHRYVEAFYRTKSGAIKKKFVKVPYSNFRGKPNRGVPNVVPQAIPETSSPAPVMDVLHLSNVDVIYSNPPSISPNSSNTTNIPTQLSSVPSLLKQSERLKPGESVRETSKSYWIDPKNEAQRVNFEFHSKEVGVPESILNILLHENNKTDNKTDSNKTDKRKDLNDKCTSLSSATSSLLKIPQSGASGSEEVVFNSNDLKVILVQPESDLHSSKKTSLIPLCENNEKAVASDKNDTEPTPTNKSSSDQVAKNEDTPEMTDSIAPSKSPDIVLLPKSVADQTKSSNPSHSDKALQILKVPQFGSDKEIPYDSQSFIPLYKLNPSKSDETIKTTSSTDSPVQILDQASPVDTSNQGGRSGMVSRKGLGKRKHDAEPVVKRRSRLSNAAVTPPSDTASQPDESKRIILTNVGRGCGGEVSVVELSQSVDAPLKIVEVDSSQKEKQDAIHRLRRLGTDVSLEEHKVTKNVSSGDTVLVTPVEDSEHQPPAIKLLEDMAKSTELPVASPVLTALGQQTVRPKRKCHQYSSEVPKVQTPVDNRQSTSKTVNGDYSKIDEDKLSAQGKSTNPVHGVESSVQIKLPSDDKVQKPNTATSVQKITRSFVQSSKNLQIVLVDKNSQNVPTEDKTKSETNEIKNSPESAIKVDLDKIKSQKNDKLKISIMPKDSLEDRNRMEIANEEKKDEEMEIAEAKCSSGVFLIRPQHYVKTVDNEQVWCCDICTVVCSQLQLFRKHYLRLHVSPKFISERDKEMWNIVEDQSGEDKLFKCHVCKVHFDKKSDLKKHLEDHPKKEESAVNKSPNQYVCPYCDAVFKWRKPFGKHKKTCLGNSKKSKKPTQHCLYCNETFFTPYRKNIHILSSHPYTRRKHPCVFCSIVFTSNIALFNHLVNQHSSYVHGCTTCKERFLNVNELKVHFKKVHPNEIFKDKNSFNGAKEYFECSKCERVFLIESCLNKHECTTRQPVDKEKAVRQKRIKPSLIERKIEGRRSTGETDFFSRVSTNIQDNLTYHLDGKLHPVEPPNHVASSHRTILNFNASVPSTSVTAPKQENVVVKSPNTPTYEKFSFPKEYDGRCGLTSFIKDASYLDISTQLIMRRNLQRLNLLSESTPDPHGDVPAVLALERLGAQCAESFGTVESAHEDEVDESDDQLPSRVVGELSGEWVRERTYVCSTCLWQTPCLWNMEDHKYTAHPHVWTPQHELNTPNHKHMASFAYRRLVDTTDSSKEERRDRGSISKREKFECSKCGIGDIRTKADLHRHIVECSGEDLVALETLHNAAVVRLPTTKRRPKWRGGGRRTRQGLKRNIPTTPPAHNSKRNRKLLRTKPGDADTIEKMIANLPAKRATRRVLGFDEIDIKTRSQATIQNNPVQVASHEYVKKPTKDKMSPPKKLEKKIQGIDTSAENGNVLSSLRMMPVKKLDLEMNDSLPPRLEMEAPMVPGNVNKEIPILTPATTSVSTCNSGVLPIKSRDMPPSKMAIVLVPPLQDPPPLAPVLKEDKNKLKNSESRLNLQMDLNPENKIKNEIVSEGEEKPKPQITSSKTPETPQIKLRSKIDPIKKRGRPAGSKNKASINQVKKEEMKKKVNTKKVQTWCLKEHVKEAKNAAGRTLKGWLIKDLDQKGQNVTNVKIQKDIKKKQPLKKNYKQKQITVKITAKNTENKIEEKSSEVVDDAEDNENKTVKSPENNKATKNNDGKATSKNSDGAKTALKNINGAKVEVKNTDAVKGTAKNNDGKTASKNTEAAKVQVKNTDTGKATAKNNDGKIAPKITEAVKVDVKNTDDVKSSVKNTDGKAAKSTPTKKIGESAKTAVKNTNIPAKGLKKAEGDKAVGKSTEIDKTSSDCPSAGKASVKNINNDKAAEGGKVTKNAECGKAVVKNAESVKTTDITLSSGKAVVKSVQGGKTVSKSPEAAGKTVEGGKATSKGQDAGKKVNTGNVRATLRSVDGDKTQVHNSGRVRASRSAKKSLDVSKSDEAEVSAVITDISANFDDSGLDKSIKDLSFAEDQPGVAGISTTEPDEDLNKEALTSLKSQDTLRKGRKKKSDTPDEDQIGEEKRRKIELQKQREETRLRKQAERKRLMEERQKKREELKKAKEEEKKRKEEEKRIAAEEELKRKEEEEERRRNELEEIKRKEEAEARLKQEEELQKKKQEEDKKRLKELEEQKQEEEKRKRKEEEEGEKRRELEEKQKKKEEEEKKRKEQEEEKKRKEEERRLKEAEKRKKIEEEERKRKEEEKRQKEEEKRKKKEEEEERKRKEQEEKRRRKEEEEKRRKEEEKKRKEEEDKRRKEEEKKRKEEEDKRRKEEEKKLKEEEDKRRKDEEKKRKEEEDKRRKEEEKKLKEEEDKRRKEEEEKKLKEEEDKRRKEEEEKKRKEEEDKRQKAEEEKKLKEEELKRKEEEEKQRREEQEKILQLELLEAEETKSSRGDSDVGSAGEMSPQLCDSEDAKLSDTDSQKSFRLKLKRKCGQKKDVLHKLNRLTLAQKIRKKKMLKKIKESATTSGKEVVSSGTKWSVEVSKEESTQSSHGQSVDMVDWLSEMPLTTPPVLKPVPNSVLLTEPISSSSSANSNVQHSSVTSSSAPIVADPMWRDGAGYQSTSTNLGSILDSVNNLLNEDLTIYSSPLIQQSLGPPQYSLADLQRAMGASDAEMAVLQQLGEIKTEEHKEEDWNEVNFIDLDKQNSGINMRSGNPATLPAPGVTNVSCTSASFNEPGGTTSWDPISRPSVSYQPPSSSISTHYSTSTMNLLQKPVDNKKPNCTLATRRKDPSSALLAAHPGKEVVCPTCSCHFVGFPALQLHISKYHPTRETTGHLTAIEAKVAGVRRMSANMCHKQDLSMLNKRALLESAKGCRLVCFMCQQILPSNLMSAHLVVEHLAKPIEITKCQVITDPISNEPASDGGDNLKNKMTSALGDLLDRAVNNLLTAKQEGQSRMSGSAIQLLNKLSAIRKREESQQRNQTTEKDLHLKVYAKNRLQAALKKGLNKNIKPANYTCGICGETFLWESTWSKHVLDVHTRLCGMPNVDDLTSDPDDPEEDDWRTESGDDVDTVPSTDGGKPAQANAPSQIVPICSDCGLGFESMPELLAHRNELHKRPQRRGSSNSLPGASLVSSRASSAATSRCTTPVPSLVSSQPTVTTTIPAPSSPPPSLQSATPAQVPPKEVVSSLPPPSISPAPIDTPPTIVPEAPPTRLTRSSASYFNPPTPPPPVLTPEGEVKNEQLEVKEEVEEVKEVKEVVKPILKTTAPVRRRGRSSGKSELVPEPKEVVKTGRRSTRLDSASSSDSNTNSGGRRSSIRLEVKPSDSITNRKNKSSTPSEASSNKRSSLKTTEAVHPSSRDDSPSCSSGSTPSSSDTKKRQRKRLSSSPSSESRPKRMISSNDDEAVRKKAEVALRELNLSFKSKKGHSMSASNTSVRWRSAMTFSPKPKSELADAAKHSSQSGSSAPTVYDFVDDQSS